MKIVLKGMFYVTLLLTGFGCSSNMQIKSKLSTLSANKGDVSISLFALKNYTDTPRAGMRASNIIDGVLLAKGYKVLTHIQDDESSFDDMRNIAIKDNSKYFIYGGVSEWRYKTGIDGEPAVSLKCVLYDTNSSQALWSATASDSNWGNSSIGTTAQSLIESMIQD